MKIDNKGRDVKLQNYFNREATKVNKNLLTVH